MPWHKVTARMEQLWWALVGMTAEIEPALHLVSQAARDEWRSLRSTWPSDRQLRAGVIPLAEQQLEVIESKVRRFRDIINGLATPDEGDTERLLLRN